MKMLMEIKIDEGRCIGDSICVTICPGLVFEMKEVSGKKKAAAVNPEGCVACHSCEPHCKPLAIRVIEKIVD